MEIWLDTINIPSVKKAKSLGILNGVTTNPSLLSGAKSPLKEVLIELLTHQEGPITAQVVASDCDEIVKQALALVEISRRIIVKIPFSVEGLKAIDILSHQGIVTMATVIFTPQQALLAAKAGAQYIAPYLGRMEANGIDPWNTLETMLKIYKNYEFSTKILAASIRDVSQVIRCAEMGVHAVTLKDQVFEQLLETDPMTHQGISQFAVDWEKAKDTSLFS